MNSRIDCRRAETTVDMKKDSDRVTYGDRVIVVARFKEIQIAGDRVRVNQIGPGAGTDDEVADHAQLTGELVGPHCRYSKTLPARIRFLDRGPGPTLLAEAVVPDPCFWTPDLPFIYSAEVRLSTAGDAGCDLAMVRRPLGIRRLGIEGTSIYLDAKRSVLRGVHVDAPRTEDLKAAREAASALYVENANDAIIREASEVGVLLAVRLGKTPKDKVIAELARMGRSPAVAIVVLNDDVPAGKELRLAARNTLLAQRLTTDAASDPASIAPWAHVLWWEISTAESIVRPPHMPVVVYRAAAQAASIAQRRRLCDQLQADTAPLADFAGYFT